MTQALGWRLKTLNLVELGSKVDVRRKASVLKVVTDMPFTML